MSEIQNITMPKWGLAMEEGMVAEWQVAEGAEIALGQEIMDIETTKIANVFESPVAGLLRRVVVHDGETVPVGALLGVCAPASVADAEVDAHIAAFLDAFDFEAVAGDAGPLSESVELSGRRLTYLKIGEDAGPPVIFVHGFGGDLNNWMFNQEAVAESYTTYALDLPGHGASTKDVGSGGLDVLSGVIVDLMDHFAIQSAHLVGHSMGGAACLQVALDHPSRVATATLIAPGGLGPEINMDYIEGFISQTRAKKLRATLEMLVADPGSITADMIEGVIRYKRLDGAAAALQKLRDGLFPAGRQAGSFRDRLDTLAVPVQVIWGAADRILPPAHGQGLPASIPVAVAEASGHMPHMEQAAEVNRLITEFTQAHSGA